MKKLIFITVCMVIGVPVFSQIQTRIEQIIKLEAYLGWLKKGYDIASKGLTLINDIKHGDFNLHDDYFNSLKQVKGPIREDAKVAAMIALQAQMLTSYKSYYSGFRASGVYTNQELDYIYRVFSGILEDAGKDIAALTAILANGDLEATDDQRIIQIDRLYEHMHQKYEVLYGFGDATKLQAIQRKKELEEINHLQNLYRP